MKLKYQNLIIIVPIFFILAGILTAFNYYIQKKELMLGLDEQMRSTTVATGIFLEYKKETILENKDEIKKSFDRILKYNIVKRILLINKNEVIIKSVSSDLKEEKDYDYKEVKLLKLYEEKDNVLYSNIVPIKESSYKLFVTIDANYITKRLEDGVEKLIMIIIIIALIGLIFSSILSVITSKNIKQLSVIARALASGNYNESTKNFFIKEINDLSNTLSVVQSVLKEMLTNTKNSILDNDFYCSSEELKKLSVINEHENAVETKDSKFSIAILDELNKKEFHCCWNNKNIVYSFVGEIDTNHDDIKDHISASGLTYIIKYYLNNDSFDLEKINKMYNIKSLLILKYDKDSKKLEEQRIFDKKISTSSKVVGKESFFSFYHNENTDPKLINYIEKYSHLNLDELIKDLKNIFEKESSVLLVKI